MSTLILTIRESIRYRGRYGHWSWVAHRISGLAVLSFLVIHVWETAMANYNPPIYEFAVALFKQPLFGVGEIALIAALLYHAFNGIRITILDFKPEWWWYQQKSAIFVWVLFLVTFTPLGIYMLDSIFNYCAKLSAAGASCWTFPTLG